MNKAWGAAMIVSLVVAGCGSRTIDWSPAPFERKAWLAQRDGRRGEGMVWRGKMVDSVRERIAGMKLREVLLFLGAPDETMLAGELLCDGCNRRIPADSLLLRYSVDYFDGDTSLFVVFDGKGRVKSTIEEAWTGRASEQGGRELN